MNDTLRSSAHSRRLLKARYQEIEQLHVKTRINRIVLDKKMPHITFYRLMFQTIQQSSPSWFIERRFSEFYTFRQSLLRRIKESKRLKHHISSLQSVLEFKFPRRHVRMDTIPIILERISSLTLFVQCLLTFYADMNIYLQRINQCTIIEEINKLIESFLCIPACQTRLEAAITGLCDVSQSNDIPCCICMIKKEEVQDECDYKLVMLPCKHFFHEDCIIKWFGMSTTCPLCRSSVIPYSNDVKESLVEA